MTKAIRKGRPPNSHQAPVGTAALHGRGEDEAAQKAPTAPPAQSQARVPRGLPTPTNSHLVQPRLTKSRGFSGRPTRGNSRIEGTRPVRSGLPPPPTSPANLDREETRAGFPYSFRGFAEVGAPRDARDVRNAPHYRSRSRLSISGGSGCADGSLVGVPFTLQWPPMAVCDGHSFHPYATSDLRHEAPLRRPLGAARRPGL